mmetsp:Transcript_9174/g.55696  ORF Transcript_9174/g.55696 Transcript_9174/m.55696 type:complete len:95 (-) Transcript_9174:3540-3824(-)
MVLVLCIGDFHVPFRSSGMPKKFLEMLVPGKIQTVLCTGNLCTKSTLQYLRSIAPDVHVVQGDFDLEEEYPAEKARTGNVLLSSTCERTSRIAS